MDPGGLETERQPLDGSCKWERPTFAWSWSIIGPGLLVCLADTDAGCLLVACQSGSRYGYGLLLLQICLIPVLFMAQDLTVRLGICTGKGHSACIREHFGPRWCWFATTLLLVECVVAMVSEMSGVAATGRLWGMNPLVSVVVASFVIIGAVLGLSYRQIEVIGVTLGAFEMTFLITMLYYHPSVGSMLQDALDHVADPEYMKLISANIGAVIMPWMIYFQQSAVVARRMRTCTEMDQERTGTLVGSITTQLIMIGALVTLAAAKSGNRDLKSMEEIVRAISPAFGVVASKVLISMAFLGGSLCAAFVVALAATWALCEAASLEDAYALEQSPTDAPFFYGSFLSVVVLGALVLLSGVNTVRLNVWVELLDGILMPVAVGFLYLLAISEVVPEPVRVKGAYKWVTGCVFTIAAWEFKHLPCVAMLSEARPCQSAGHQNVEFGDVHAHTITAAFQICSCARCMAEGDNG
ncbi:unnamed protein product [Durusdinium trenchii]|uniref:Natural resistance-associated macrophage protein n=1 Tax=Durusdinium trenchii TaxID=1381693 RepID=A0ABP0QCS9_9DINO